MLIWAALWVNKGVRPLQLEYRLRRLTSSNVTNVSVWVNVPRVIKRGPALGHKDSGLKQSTHFPTRKLRIIPFTHIPVPFLVQCLTRRPWCCGLLLDTLHLALDLCSATIIISDNCYFHVWIMEVNKGWNATSEPSDNIGINEWHA